MQEAKRLILGTVQFGLDYGINNQKGKPRADEVFEILDYAHNQGIRILDTAEAYGNAIDIIGTYHQNSLRKFDVITKFKIDSEVHVDIAAMIQQSLKRLHIKQIWGYMYHSFSDYMEYSHVLDQLKVCKSAGLIKHLGVSIYTNEEFEQILKDDSVDLIQLPYNLLDNANLRQDLLAEAKKQNKIIHTRSAFLQGLFFKDEDSLPEKLQPLKNDLIQLKQLSADHDVEMGTLALNYVVANQKIDHVLIGVDNLTQLEENIKSLHGDHLPLDLIHDIEAIKVEDITLLNPSNWS